MMKKSRNVGLKRLWSGGICVLLTALIALIGGIMANAEETEYSEGLVFSSYGYGTCYVSGRGTCTDSVLIIPPVSPAGEQVTRIKNETFANCPWLTEVVIPEGVTSLGEGAFKNCPNLTSVSIPESMKTISKDVFAGCTKLVETENGVIYVDTWVVGSVSGITEAEIRDGTRGIAESAFARRDSLVRLSIPESVKHIGQYAFTNCTGLETIRYDAYELADVFSDYNSVFYNAGRNGPGIEVTIGAHTETIPTRLFCPYNSYSTDPSKYAPNIVSLVFEEGSACKYIQYNAFLGCSNLATVTLPEGLKTLDGTAFGGCDSLTELRIPDSVTYVINGSSVGGTALEIVNGVRYVDTWAVGYERGVKDVVLRDGTVGIAASAFEYYSMDTLVIPASLKYVGDLTFDSILDTIGDLYYMGTRQDWSAITFGTCNATLGTATYHYLGDLFDLTSASLTLGDSLTMNYYAKADPAYGTPAMRFTYRGKTETVRGVPTETEGEYVFSLKGIAPQCMGENIKAELILVWEDGTEFVMDTKESYSIRRYCDDALAANPNNEALTTLLADLLAYGDAAQDYANYNEDTPVSEGFEVAPSEWEDVTDTDFTLTDKTHEDIRFVSAGVRFDFVNRLYFKIKTADPANVTLTVGDKTYTVKEMTPAEEADGTYILYTDPICATEFDKVFTAELSVDGEVIQTLTYSVKSYVCAKQNSENTEIAALVRALYRYGRSAIAYKNAQ